MNIRGRKKRVRTMEACLIDALEATDNIHFNEENYNASDDALLEIAKWFYDAEMVKSGKSDNNEMVL